MGMRFTHASHMGLMRSSKGVHAPLTYLYDRSASSPLSGIALIIRGLKWVQLQHFIDMTFYGELRE